MREPALDDVVARRFLLGQLPPEEEERIQELAFEDHDTFVFLESVQDDLIDEFFRGELSADEQGQFESYFLSQPGRRHDVKISRVLQRQFDRISPDSFSQERPVLFWLRKQSLVRILITVGAIALIAILVGLFYFLRQAGKPAPMHAGPDAPAAIPSPQFTVSPSVQPTDSPSYVQSKPKSPAPEKQKNPSTYALLAPSPLSRGEGVQPLILASGVSTMTIELALITPTNFRSYEAVLKNEAGTVLQDWPNLKAQRLTSGKALKIELPVALLKSQEFYHFVVSAANSEGKKEVIAQYPFEVRQ
jgi:hypothetical protein